MNKTSITITGIDQIILENKQVLTDLVHEVADTISVESNKNTPIKTGNARKNWKKSVSDTGFVIQNSVPYIERLDDGYSKQSPDGIVKPTISTINRKYK